MDTIVIDTFETISDQPSKKLRLTALNSGDVCLVLKIDDNMDGGLFHQCEHRRRFGRHSRDHKRFHHSRRHHRDLRCRLMDMGITPGTKLKIIQTQNIGPILLEVRDSKLALGRGMARRVIVSKIE